MALLDQSTRAWALWPARYFWSNATVSPCLERNSLHKEQVALAHGTTDRPPFTRLQLAAGEWRLCWDRNV